MWNYVLAFLHNTAIQVSLSAGSWREELFSCQGRPLAKRLELLSYDDEVLLMTYRFLWSNTTLLREFMFKDIAWRAWKTEYGVTILGIQAKLCSLIVIFFFFLFFFWRFSVYFPWAWGSKALYDFFLYSIFPCHYIVHAATIVIYFCFPASPRSV